MDLGTHPTNRADLFWLVLSPVITPRTGFQVSKRGNLGFFLWYKVQGRIDVFQLVFTQHENRMALEVKMRVARSLLPPPDHPQSRRMRCTGLMGVLFTLVSLLQLAVALRIAAFNIRTFGETKMSNATISRYIVKVSAGAHA